MISSIEKNNNSIYMYLYHDRIRETPTSTGQWVSYWR